MNKRPAGRVVFVGAGPGPADLITVRGARALAAADIVLHDALTNPAVQSLGLMRPLEPVRGTRGLGKHHMIHNDYLPRIDVDSETYEVRADGELLVCEPAKVLPMAQRYFLF